MIVGLLALTGVRRVLLALFVNLCFLFILVLGLLFFSRFNLQYGLYFIWIMSAIILLSLSLMFTEAFTLYEPDTPNRKFVFYVNIPIVVDIGFVISYFLIYYRYLKPLYLESKRKQLQQMEEAALRLRI